MKLVNTYGNEYGYGLGLETTYTWSELHLGAHSNKISEFHREDNMLN